MRIARIIGRGPGWFRPWWKTYVCDWGDCATGCTMQSLAPITCQKDGWCSIRPDIVQDAKVRIVGNGPVRIMIEDCVRRLLSHDVDSELDGTIDRKIDLFWDEMTHFQNR